MIGLIIQATLLIPSQNQDKCKKVTSFCTSILIAIYSTSLIAYVAML